MDWNPLDTHLFFQDSWVQIWWKTLPDLYITPPSLTQIHFIHISLQIKYVTDREYLHEQLYVIGGKYVSKSLCHSNITSRRNLFVNNFIYLRISIGIVRDDHHGTMKWASILVPRTRSVRYVSLCSLERVARNLGYLIRQLVQRQEVIKLW